MHLRTKRDNARKQITLRVSALSSFVCSMILCLAAAAAHADDKTVFNFTTIDPPGSILTIPFAINPAGDVVGLYTDAVGMTHGYLFHDNAFTPVDFPGASGTRARGINPQGDVVGY